MILHGIKFLKIHKIVRKILEKAKIKFLFNNKIKNNSIII